MPNSPLRGHAAKTAIHREFLVLALAAQSLSCSAAGRSDPEYRTARIERRSLSPVVTALGTVRPQVGAEVRLGARIPGKVEHLSAELAAASSKLEALETQGPLEVRRAEADSSRLNARLDLAVLEHERQSTLFDRNLTSRQNLDVATQELAVAREEFAFGVKALELARNRLESDLEAARAELDAARAALRVAEVELSYATLRAPISGIIASVSTQEGETVAVGLSAPTFVTIIDLKRLQVETYVDEVDIGRIEVGQQAAFTVEAFPAVEIESEVVTIYPKAIVRDNVVFYSVVVSSPASPPVELRPEMTANVSILLSNEGDVLMVPATAVRKSAGGSYVYLLVDGKPVRREVGVGWRQGRFLQVTHGLEEGDEVLAEPDQTEGAR